ncbi:MAG: hypothetical protein HYZ45_14970, partial [Burkholderiales bacterium]|nr:hypothetical protein [Burkholderiales bacterium]
MIICTPASAQIRILVYGDSNTWGWRPESTALTSPRYSDEERWAGVMQAR